MKELLHKLIDRVDLSRQEAHSAFDAIMSGSADASQIAALLMGIAAKGASLDELVAAATVMREKSLFVATPAGATVLDTCGTGGDVKGTFNISTAAAIVIAACGVIVVKHGNRSASSKSGSADVLEKLEVNLDAGPEGLQRSLAQAGICFAFARAHHPAMKFVAPVRQSLGVPTIFNLLGPLTNPGRARRQLLGVFKPHLTQMMAAALLDLGSERAWVVHAEDGLDEISTMSPTTICELIDGTLVEHVIDSRTYGVPRARLSDLQVGSPEESAETIRAILAGKSGPAADIVAINAAAGLVIAGRANDLGQGLETARAALVGGAARKTLEALVRASALV